MSLGFLKPEANSSTLKPFGTTGIAPSGRLISFGPFWKDGDSKGFGMSAIVIRLRTPGASVVQSPIAPCPVKTLFCFCASTIGDDEENNATVTTNIVIDLITLLLINVFSTLF